MVTKPVISTADIVAFEPDQTMRNLIGKDTNLADIFTPQRIDACQNVIDTARMSFFEVVGKDLARLEASIKNLPKETTDADPFFENIAAHAANVRGHAELFGYALLATISNQILANCEAGKVSPGARMRIIADLIKMLHVSIAQKISDESGLLAKALKASMREGE